MISQPNTTNPEVTTRLGFRNGFLCVLAERSGSDGPQPKTLKLWYPVREAQEAETRTLEGRPVAEMDRKEGIYVDEEGAVFQLAGKGATKPILIEEVADQGGELGCCSQPRSRTESPRARPMLCGARQRTGRRTAKELGGSAQPNTDEPSGAPALKRQIRNSCRLTSGRSWPKFRAESATSRSAASTSATTTPTLPPQIWQARSATSSPNWEW